MHLYAHHLVISGFRQHRGRVAGCDRVVARLDRYRRPGVHVELFPWNADWHAEAQFIDRHAPPGFKPLVCIYAYSWGFGWGAIRLAEALAALRRPLRVYGLVGCDGVYRHGYRCGNWRALWPWATIRLPRNVDREGVSLFHQTRSLPRGHKVVDACGGEIERQEIHAVTQLDGAWHLESPATHLNIDEAPEWLAACETLAGKVETIVQRKAPRLGSLRLYQPEGQG